MIKKRIVKARRAARRSAMRLRGSKVSLTAPLLGLSAFSVGSKSEAQFQRSVIWRQDQGIGRRKSLSRPNPQSTSANVARRVLSNQAPKQQVRPSRRIAVTSTPECTSGQQSNAAIGWHSGRSRPARASGSSSRSTALANAAPSIVPCAHARKHWQRWTGSGSILRVCGIGCARAVTRADPNERHRASLLSADAPRQSP